MGLRTALNKRLRWSTIGKQRAGCYAGRLPFDREASVHIAIVGSERNGLARQGKVSPNNYFPVFEYGAIEAGASVVFYLTPSDLLRSIHIHDTKPLAIIFLYNEERLSDYPTEQTLYVLQDRPHTILYNSPAIAHKIAEKPVTNKVLAQAAIDVPRMMDKADIPLFSNMTTGSGKPTSVIHRSSAVDTMRYNTELIDTRIEFDSREYFCTLRALCVSSKVLDISVRCRPVSDGNPNVHSRDTPLNLSLLNYIYYQYVQPRAGEIGAICAKIATTLGPALYAHDILLSKDGRLPVCEVGWKFDNRALIDHLWPIAPKLTFMHGTFRYEFAAEAARLISEKAAALR